MSTFRRFAAWLVPLALVAIGLTPTTLAGAVVEPAGVTIELDSSSVDAGACGEVGIHVIPSKDGQLVEIQREQDGAWTTLTEPVLDDRSRASASLCWSWADLGDVRLRGMWPAQDAASGQGTSETVSLRVNRAHWMRRIDRLTRGRAFSVSIGSDGSFLYGRKDSVRRAPGSNEKLLLSMALLDRLGPDERLLTRAASGRRVSDGKVRGNLWILGSGDPETGPAGMRALAGRIRDAGVQRIDGRVMGGTSYFARDWWARGWKDYFPRVEVALPTALTFEVNRARGVHIRDPERRAAAALTKQLRVAGVRVGGKPGAGRPPRDLREIAAVASAPLVNVLRRMNVDSRNFYAEVLGKRLGVERSGTPGTIRKGAAAIEAWARVNGERVTAFDSSGLSYRNRVTAEGMVRLLWAADGTAWANELRAALPKSDQGTLKNRLRHVLVRAKTGTLDRVSALSGWVWLKRLDDWAEFSILSRGTTKAQAVRIEDAIVRAVAENAS
jgi:D-alanyl-D-alanine carboxypeptidase